MVVIAHIAEGTVVIGITCTFTGVHAHAVSAASAGGIAEDFARRPVVIRRADTARRILKMPIAAAVAAFGAPPMSTARVRFVAVGVAHAHRIKVRLAHAAVLMQRTRRVGEIVRADALT